MSARPHLAQGKILFVLDPVTPPQAAPIAVPRGARCSMSIVTSFDSTHRQALYAQTPLRSVASLAYDRQRWQRLAQAQPQHDSQPKW